MTTENFKWVLYIALFISLALIGSINWRTDGWVGNTFTIVAAVCAVLALAIAMRDLATA